MTLAVDAKQLMDDPELCFEEVAGKVGTVPLTPAIMDPADTDL